MDKVKEYLEKLRQTNPSLLAPENRGELMKMMSQEFNVEFRSELALTNFAKNKGFELSAFEKKNDVQNEGMDLDSQQDQKPSSLELPSTPIQDGGVVVDLSAAQKRSNYVSDLRRRERFLIKDDLYSGITADFLDTDEKQVKIALTKELIGKGFQINEKQAGANALEIVASNGNKLDVDLSYDLEDRFGDLFETQIQETPLGIGPTVASTMVTAAGTQGTNRSMNLITQSKKIREFLKENTSDLSFTLQNEFSQISRLEAMTKCQELAGGDWYWNIDGQGVFHFRARPSSAIHIFQIGVDVEEITVEKNVEEMVNHVVVNYDGGQHVATDSASITAYGLRAVVLDDSDIKTLASAQLRANNELTKSTPKLRTKIVINSNYDLESVKVGETCRVRGLKEGSTTLGDNMQIMSLSYKPDKVTLTLDEYQSLSNAIKNIV